MKYKTEMVFKHYLKASSYINKPIP